MTLDLTLIDHLVEQAVRWSEAWTAAWGEDGEPVDGNWDGVYALEDEAREIVEGLAIARVPDAGATA